MANENKDYINSPKTNDSNNEMLLRCLQRAKEEGVDTILMASVDRVMGPVEEIDKIREAYEASGVTLETLDGSHMLPQDRDLIIATCMSSGESETKD